MYHPYLIYMVVHGFCFGVMLMIAFYLLTSTRSAYNSDIEPNQHVRQTAGWNAALWAFTFFVPLIYPFIDGTRYGTLTSDLDSMMSMLVIPSVSALLLSLVQMHTLIRRYLLFFLIIPLGLIAYYLIDPQPWQEDATFVYWSVFIVAFAFWFYRQEKKYHRRLRDLYSDIESHEISWIYRIILLFIFYYVLFAVSRLIGMQPILYVSYFYCLVLWTLLVYHVDHYECMVHFWSGEEEAKVTRLVEPSAAEGQETAEVTAYEWLGPRLQKECEEAGLYLRHDLNIDTLAAHLGTNRTYISRYLASKGITYYIYINTLRVNHAKKLIRKDPDLSIFAVAFQSGFKSDSTFRRAFLDIEGCTPSEYAKRLN